MAPNNGQSNYIEMWETFTRKSMRQNRFHLSHVPVANMCKRKKILLVSGFKMIKTTVTMLNYLTDEQQRPLSPDSE